MPSTELHLQDNNLTTRNGPRTKGQGLRLAKACEHCRKTKRRCQLPYPCRTCVRHGLQCAVRDAARPRRKAHNMARLHPRPSVQSSVFMSPSPLGSNESDGPSPSQSVYGDLSLPGTTFEVHQALKTAGLSARQSFDIVCHLVSVVAKERYDHHFQCELIEPQQTAAGKISTLAISQRPQLISTISGLIQQDISQMLSSLEGSKVAPIDLLDLEDLKASAKAIFHNTDEKNTLGDIDLRTTTVPLDRLALLFAALANSNFESPDAQTCPAFLELSTIMGEDYAGESTLNLAFALLLQHVCVHRTSTSNRGRALVAQAVRVAHDLGLNRGLGAQNAFQAARFYLLLYFCDLYSAMTYNTVPYIKPGDYEPSVFQPLLHVYPRLQTLVELLGLNGQILNKLYNEPYSYDNVIRLEQTIGQVCPRFGKPLNNKWHTEDRFEFRCETLALNHMFWSRILLRVPLLLSQAHWVASLSICLRAAQTLLSTYFSILGPGIKVMAHTATLPIDNHRERQLQEATHLPPTWRQVQRITTSALIVLYAFWHGEASYDEAGRSCATSILLLEFRRTRWGSNLDDAQRSIRALAAVSGIWLRPYLEEMLPDATEEWLVRLAADPSSLSSALQDQDKTFRDQNRQDGGFEHTPGLVPPMTYAYAAGMPPHVDQQQTCFGVAGTSTGEASPVVPSWGGAETVSDALEVPAYPDFLTSPFWSVGDS